MRLWVRKAHDNLQTQLLLSKETRLRTNHYRCIFQKGK